MHVFVTGATGFVGSGVCRTLLKAGHQVSGLTSKPEKAEILRKNGIEPIVGDMRDAEVVGPTAKEADVTITCTYLTTKGRFTKTKLSMVDSAMRKHAEIVVEAASANKRRVIHSAGFLIFGEGPDGWADETCPLAPPRFSQGFVNVGRWLLEQHEKEKVNGAVIAPGFVYGPSGSFAEMAQMIRKGSMRLAGGGRFYWSPIHIDDLAAAYLAAAEGKADGKTVLVVDDKPMLIRDMMYELADALKAKRPRSVPKFLAKLFMGGVMVEGFTSSRRCRNTLAKTTLGWQPKYPTYRDGLPAVVQQLTAAHLT